MERFALAVEGLEAWNEDPLRLPCVDAVFPFCLPEGDLCQKVFTMDFLETQQ